MASGLGCVYYNFFDQKWPAFPMFSFVNLYCHCVSRSDCLVAGVFVFQGINQQASIYL